MSNSSVHGAGCFSIKEFISSTYKLLCFYSRSANVNAMNKYCLIGHVDLLKYMEHRYLHLKDRKIASECFCFESSVL
jgi:hypothetical protein